MAEHVMTFEQFQEYNKQLDEGFFGDAAKKIGKGVSKLMYKMDLGAVMSNIEQNFKLYIIQGMKKFKDYNKETWVNAFNQAQEVNWDFDKIDDEYLDYVQYLWNRGEVSASFQSSPGSVGNQTKRPNKPTGKLITVEEI